MSNGFPGARARHLMLALLAAQLGCALAACHTSSAAVALSPDWPEQPGAYGDAHRDWTRSGTIHSDYQQVLEVFATFKAPAFRAAYVRGQREKNQLSAADVESLRGAQEQAAAGEYEVELLVTTWDRRENDLHRGARSVWSLHLIDDQGNQVAPSSVRRDRRPRWVVRAEYPDMGDFAQAYVVRFPRTIDVLRPDASRFRLRMASSRGAVELVWQNRGR